MNAFMKSAITIFRKNGSKMLVGAGIAGMAVAIVSAVEDTPKALKCIEEAKKEKGDELTKKEVVQASWKCYIRTAVIAGSSAACIIVGTVQQARQHTALMAAYSLLESSARDYRNKVVETVGAEKEEEIQTAVSKDKAKKKSVEKADYIITSGTGEDLMMDQYTGRLFYGSAAEIKKRLVDLNYQLYSETWLSMNEVYYTIGIDGVPAGNVVGWNVERGPIEPKFVAGLTDDDRPCVVLTFKDMPRVFG